MCVCACVCALVNCEDWTFLTNNVRTFIQSEDVLTDPHISVINFQGEGLRLEAGYGVRSRLGHGLC